MKTALFEESTDGYVPCTNMMAVMENKFKYAGELCAFSGALGGAAPSFLAPWVYSLLTGGLTSVHFDINKELKSKCFEDTKKQVMAL